VRLRQLEVVVQICRLMWTEVHPTFHGKYFVSDDAAATSLPDVVPPICIGGSGDRVGLPIVGRRADIWNGFAAATGSASGPSSTPPPRRSVGTLAP
jgi:alkanesulfonate monooxygenase SsuD/methylene tetrahydromethanopterin reductase-like flavin-dependent oxidoreductase (luciferase family)